MNEQQKTWFDGLKFAESQGSELASHYVATNEFDGCTWQFLEGVLDYIDHCNRRLGVNNVE